MAFDFMRFGMQGAAPMGGMQRRPASRPRSGGAFQAGPSAAPVATPVDPMAAPDPAMTTAAPDVLPPAPAGPTQSATEGAFGPRQGPGPSIPPGPAAFPWQQQGASQGAFSMNPNSSGATMPSGPSLTGQITPRRMMEPMQPAQPAVGGRAFGNTRRALR